MKQYPAARPHITKKEERYVLEVLRSGVLSFGPFQEKFERAFAEKVGVRFACAVSSGTAGLHLSLIAAGIGEDDEVITSPFSFVASSNSLLYVGARPIFADIDERTYNMNPDDIEHRITPKTIAILVVHIFGQSAEMDRIMQIAKKHNLKVIEDACESLLSTWQGMRAGTFGTSGVFAFYPNKQITTGEGGMIVTDDPKLDTLCRSLRNQGRGDAKEWLDHVRLGFNYRMDELSAAVGLAQMERLDMLLQKRAQIAAWYDEALSPLSELITLPYVHPVATHTWFVYVIRLRDARICRDALIADLARQGIHCKPYLPSIHLFGFYRQRFGFSEGMYPVCERVSETTLALPFYIGLSKRDIAYIAQVLHDTLHNHEKDNI